MPVDQSLVGREFPPTQPYRVSAEKVRELAAATGSAPGPVPATFPIVSLRQIGGNDIIGTRSEIRDAGGDLVCTTTATLVHRGDA